MDESCLVIFRLKCLILKDCLEFCIISLPQHSKSDQSPEDLLKTMYSQVLQKNSKKTRYDKFLNIFNILKDLHNNKFKVCHFSNSEKINSLSNPEDQISLLINDCFLNTIQYHIKQEYHIYYSALLSND